MDNGATEREEKRDRTSHKDWTEQMKMSLFYFLCVSLLRFFFSLFPHVGGSGKRSVPWIKMPQDQCISLT